jgi:hypothetical protein
MPDCYCQGLRGGGRAWISETLAGSDLRSTGKANDVAREMLANPAMTGEAVRLLSGDDPVLRARTADALEKASSERPAIIQSHKRTLLGLAATARQQEVKWHLAQMLPRLELSSRERTRAMVILRSYSGDPSRIVRVCAMQALWDLGTKRGQREAWVVSLVEQMALAGSPAVRARARRLLQGSDSAAPRKARSGRR